MFRFAGSTELFAVLGGATKWRRAATAIERASAVPGEVALSIGDSLTYRVTSRPDCSELTGHRRYLEVRAVLEGSSLVEVAPVALLEAVDDYSDLTDRQHFTGPARGHILSAGEIVVVERGEAIRDVDVSGQVVVLRVTVEE